MKRFHLSTLMLLIVIAALCVALVAQSERASRREAALQLRMYLLSEAYVQRERQIQSDLAKPRVSVVGTSGVNDGNSKLTSSW
jgi:hypothetical protein